MHPECRATVEEICSDEEVHRRYSQSMWYEVVFRPWEVHTHGIGVETLSGAMCELELTEEADSVHIYAEYLVQR